LNYGNSPDARFQFQGGTVVKVRYLSTLTAAAGFLVAGQSLAAEPARLPTTTAPLSVNQKLADTIAEQLGGITETSELTITAQDGVVTLSGVVRNDAHKHKIIREVELIPGVAMIRDGLSVSAELTPAQITDAPAAMPPSARQILPSFGPVVQAPTVAIPPGDVNASPVIEPVPVGPSGIGVAGLAAPPLPPHAWPTYAPYNNLSRVAYPQAYPYNAFPFIGPFYPFPKVPLGWRSVLLEWEDGHWWIGKTQSPHDYWRVRFW
jgi:hypothetical protein